jgi:hypothetical protein
MAQVSFSQSDGKFLKSLLNESILSFASSNLGTLDSLLDLIHSFSICFFSSKLIYICLLSSSRLWALSSLARHSFSFSQRNINKSLPDNPSFSPVPNHLRNTYCSVYQYLLKVTPL